MIHWFYRRQIGIFTILGLWLILAVLLYKQERTGIVSPGFSQSAESTEVTPSSGAAQTSHPVLSIGSADAPVLHWGSATLLPWWATHHPTVPGTIIITVRHSGPASCLPPPSSRPVRQDDGTYQRSSLLTVSAVSCWSDTTWREEWSALPEDGGIFIQRIVE
mgnify:CR=1 FL=1